MNNWIRVINNWNKLQHWVSIGLWFMILSLPWAWALMYNSAVVQRHPFVWLLAFCQLNHHTNYSKCLIILRKIGEWIICLISLSFIHVKDCSMLYNDYLLNLDSLANAWSVCRAAFVYNIFLTLVSDWWQVNLQEKKICFQSMYVCLQTSTKLQNVLSLHLCMCVSELKRSLHQDVYFCPIFNLELIIDWMMLQFQVLGPGIQSSGL